MEVYSEKLPYVRNAPAGAFYPAKITFLDFWDMLNLKKLHFCHICSFFHPIDAVWARIRHMYMLYIWLYSKTPPCVGHPNPCRTRSAHPNPCHRSRFEEAGRRLSSNGPRTRAEAISKLIDRLAQSGLRHEGQAEPVPRPSRTHAGTHPQVAPCFRERKVGYWSPSLQVARVLSNSARDLQ